MTENATHSDWTVRQQGLDGETARGQVTLDGDVVRDTEGNDA